MFVVYIVFVL